MILVDAYLLSAARFDGLAWDTNSDPELWVELSHYREVEDSRRPRSNFGCSIQFGTPVRFIRSALLMA
ncbi:hypothetical protein ACVWZR_000770 [Bradyrhizobium sp. i1.3.1]